jgi:hypothetical protein
MNALIYFKNLKSYQDHVNGDVQNVKQIEILKNLYNYGNYLTN